MAKKPYMAVVINKGLTTHTRKDCKGGPCCLHRPSDHELKDAPIFIRMDKWTLAERICPHGVGHPDPDSVAYLVGRAPAGMKREIRGVLELHGCDGCCRVRAKPAVFRGSVEKEAWGGWSLNKTKADRYLLSSFRKAWRWYSPERKECLKAKACIKCGTEGVKLYADHVEPVVDPKVGWQGWDEYYKRLMQGKLQPLCKTCHDRKTKTENKQRRQRKNGKP